jgi:uncharacterized protein (DUF1330 family)
MAAYLYGNIQIHDMALYEQYRAQVPAIIASYGGRYLVRGGAVEVVEGNVDAQRQVILEFPDMTALKAFYFSKEYAPLIAIRQKAATGSIVLIEGYLP